jgi:hypothetical protein
MLKDSELNGCKIADTSATRWELKFRRKELIFRDMTAGVQLEECTGSGEFGEK